MGIVGLYPEGGVRVVVERPWAGGPPWRYTGEAATESARFALALLLDADGAVTIDLPPGAPAGLAEKVRLIVRAVWRHTREADAPPPLRLARWRAES